MNREQWLNECIQKLRLGLRAAWASAAGEDSRLVFVAEQEWLGEQEAADRRGVVVEEQRRSVV